ncbi:hypothetical protein RDI58_002253 [Solanum bulbocastanum]|uniref:Uncharacterized protein n=1 Tax=Solanum bulbocastanum TaxID=147425 RepID=A0AAN8U6E9_SOLBU
MESGESTTQNPVHFLLISAVTELTTTSVHQLPDPHFPEPPPTTRNDQTNLFSPPFSLISGQPEPPLLVPFALVFQQPNDQLQPSKHCLTLPDSTPKPPLFSSQRNQKTPLSSSFSIAISGIPRCSIFLQPTTTQTTPPTSSHQTPYEYTSPPNQTQTTPHFSPFPTSILLQQLSQTPPAQTAPASDRSTTSNHFHQQLKPENRTETHLSCSLHHQVLERASNAGE